MHAMRQLFTVPETEAVILVDATNAYNSLNRRAALQNIHHVCSSLSSCVHACMRANVSVCACVCVCFGLCVCV